MARIYDPEWSPDGRDAAVKAGSRTIEAFVRAAGLPCARRPVTGRPSYDPDYWNEGSRRAMTNCYGYALNRPNVWVSPGDGDCADPADTTSRLFNKIVADGLHPAPLQNPPDIEGYYLAALVSGHGWHWYRKDANGLWSHKDGDGPVSNLDESGKLILDPKMADRGVYSNFISYFYVPC